MSCLFLALIYIPLWSWLWSVSSKLFGRHSGFSNLPPQELRVKFGLVLAQNFDLTPRFWFQERVESQYIYMAIDLKGVSGCFLSFLWGDSSAVLFGKLQTSHKKALGCSTGIIL